jgi:cold shock CspA family protein
LPSDVLVLVACDGDYIPLVRKLNTIGTRVMLISWDFNYIDDQNNERLTRTSQQLLEEVAFPVAMHEIIDNRVEGKEALVNALFVAPKTPEKPDVSRMVQRDLSGHTPELVNEQREKSSILSLKDGYGFISKPAVNNVFFHFSSLQNADFNDLEVGMKVSFVSVPNPDTAKGGFVADAVWLDKSTEEERGLSSHLENAT